MSAAELTAARALPQASTVTPKSMIAVGVCLPVLAALSVALRFYVRLTRKVALGLDDMLILMAQVGWFQVDQDSTYSSLRRRYFVWAWV